jgi:uncharacterized membrane protein HdeD (DUF308 family)
MNSVLGQQLWKVQLAAGVLTIALGAMLLAWPGPSIPIASTMFGVYLLMSGLAELFWHSPCRHHQSAVEQRVAPNNDPRLRIVDDSSYDET